MDDLRSQLEMIDRILSSPGFPVSTNHMDHHSSPQIERRGQVTKSNNSKILLVLGDREEEQRIFDALKGHGYQLLIARDGGEAIFLAHDYMPDLILLDLFLPRVNGFHVLSGIRADWRLKHVKVVALTRFPSEKQMALERGADDFFPKPVDPDKILLRIRRHLDSSTFPSDLHHREELLYNLARKVEQRDLYGAYHIDRVAQWSVKLGEVLNLPEKELRVLRKGALLHDIGKIGIPDRVLLAPRDLVQEEFELIKFHSELGDRLVEALFSYQDVQSIVRHHHERWDGHGYPDQLRGEETNLFARVVAVADAFEALTSDRSYRKAFSKFKALSVLDEGAHQQWDPNVVEVGLQIFSK